MERVPLLLDFVRERKAPSVESRRGFSVKSCRGFVFVFVRCVRNPMLSRVFKDFGKVSVILILVHLFSRFQRKREAKKKNHHPSRRPRRFWGVGFSWLLFGEN